MAQADYGLLQPTVKLNTPFESLNSILQLRQQQQQIASNQALEQERRDASAKQQSDLKLQQDIDAAMAAGGSHADILARIQQTHGHVLPVIQKQFADADKYAADAAEAKQKAEAADMTYASHLASGVLYWEKDGPEAMMNAAQAAIQHAQANGHDLSQLSAAIQQDPSSLKARMQAVIAQAQGPAPITAPTEASIALKAGQGDPASVAAMQLLKPPPQATGASEDERYRKIQAAALQKQAVSPADLAWAQGYEKQKTLGPEATAAAAANRQTATIQQQIAQQGRSQTFAEQQAGRSELTNKVEQPYLDAQEKASTLRSVIDAAKNGNMAAANVQSLLGTLGLVTMEGVKRINTTELNQVAGAGSLLERIKGQVSRISAGQPMSDKLQSDLGQLSDLLEKSARAKYLAGHAATVKRYGLTDEQPLGGAAPTPPPANETPEQRLKRLLGGG